MSIQTCWTHDKSSHAHTQQWLAVPSVGVVRYHSKNSSFEAEQKKRLKIVIHKVQYSHNQMYSATYNIDARNEICIPYKSNYVKL
jgi:hypothetical protein